MLDACLFAAKPRKCVQYKVYVYNILILSYIHISFIIQILNLLFEITFLQRLK